MPRSLALLVVLACACSGDPKPATMAPLAHHVPPPRPDAACTGKRALRTVTLPRDREIVLSPGLRVTYRGQSEDLDADGTAAVFTMLELGGAASDRWLPDTRDHALHHVAGHCMRVVSSRPDAVTLEVDVPDLADAPAMRCEMACCVTEAQRKPAPGGELECCICHDDP
jgi:hypothetical protein